MESIDVTLPETIANALAEYLQDQETGSPGAVVQSALEEFLAVRGYLSANKRGLRLAPASKGSGFADTSVNHDRVLAEQTFLQKLPKSQS